MTVITFGDGWWRLERREITLDEEGALVADERETVSGGEWGPAPSGWQEREFVIEGGATLSSRG